MHSTLSVSKLAVGIALFVLAGFPLVAYVWETLNQLMAGAVHPTRLLLSLPLLLLLAGLLLLLARAIGRWEAERAERAHAAEGHSSHGL
jgi:hypothetical protein